MVEKLVSFVVFIATWSSYINPILVTDITFKITNRVESIGLWSVTGYISCFLATVSFFLVILLLLSDLLFYFHRREKALAVLVRFPLLSITLSLSADEIETMTSIPSSTSFFSFRFVSTQYVFLSAPLVLATHFGVLFGYGDYKSTDYMGNPNINTDVSYSREYYGSGLLGPQFIYFFGFLILHGVSVCVATLNPPLFPFLYFSFPSTHFYCLL